MIMETTYLYCYTRTKNIDYRHVFGLSYAVCPEEIQEVFTKRIRAILNQTDDSNLSTPVYVFFREGGFALYGVVCLNSVLSADYCNEKTNGRVRGFLGVVTNTLLKGIDKIPLSLDFYEALYKQYVVPVWDSYTFQYENDKMVDTSDFPVSKSIDASGMVGSINTASNHCRMFSNTWDGESLLAEALSTDGNISIALNIDDERQVTMPDYYPLMNAQMKYSIADSFEDREVQHRCAQCRELVDQLYEDGMCYKCWKEKNEPEPTPAPQLYTCQKCGTSVDSLTDGLCEQCYRRQRDKAVHPKPKCSKCGCEADMLYTKYGLCNECYAEYAKKQRIKNILFSAGVIVFIVFILVIWKLKPTPSIVFNADGDSVLYTNDSSKIESTKSCAMDTLEFLNEMKKEKVSNINQDSDERF